MRAKLRWWCILNAYLQFHLFWKVLWESAGRCTNNKRWFHLYNICIYIKCLKVSWKSLQIQLRVENEWDILSSLQVNCTLLQTKTEKISNDSEKWTVLAGANAKFLNNQKAFIARDFKECLLLTLLRYLIFVLFSLFCFQWI